MYNKSFPLDFLLKKEEFEDPAYFEYNNNNNSYCDNYDYLQHWFLHPTVKKEEGRFHGKPVSVKNVSIGRSTLFKIYINAQGASFYFPQKQLNSKCSKGF